jgi:hypothetical protein
MFDETLNEKAKSELLRKIRRESLFIGSRAWNVETDDSDYDYLIQYEKLQDIFHIIEEKYYDIWKYKKMFEQSWGDSCDQERSREFYSIIIMIGDKKYNIISPMDTINYRAWKMAAGQFEKFIGDSIIEEKENRVKLFECFKDIYRNKYYKRKRKKTAKQFEENNFPF